MIGRRSLVLTMTTSIYGEPPPGFVSDVPGTATIYNLSSELGPSVREPVGVLIEPVSAGVRFWTFMAITNNVTQEVTVTSPQ